MTTQDKYSAESGKSLLEGVVILDVTNVLAGPFATYLLALLGARVIKVEHLRGGDLARRLGGAAEFNNKLMGTSFIAQNCSKQSVAIDLKSNKGKEIFCRLAGASDVLVENFRPGVMERIGLGYSTLSKLHPKLIYCAISGFGQDGPDALNPAYDQIIQGKSGLMAVTGEEGGGPLRCGIPIADTVGGLNAALGVVAALYQRRDTGKGMFIDVAMLDSLLPMMGWVASNFLQAGIAPQRMGNENFTAAPSGAFDTSDGKLNIAANKQEQWEELCRLLGLEELITDPRFADRDERKCNRSELNPILTLKLRQKKASEWVRILNAKGIPCGEILSLEDALVQPQVEHRKLIQKVDDPKLGPLRVFGMPIQFSPEAHSPAALSPPPRLGEHTAQVLEELGYAPSEVQSLAEQGVIGLSD